MLFARPLQYIHRCVEQIYVFVLLAMVRPHEHGSKNSMFGCTKAKVKSESKENILKCSIATGFKWVIQDYT